MEINQIAYIKTDFKEKFGIPRQSGRVDALKGKIVFDTKYKDKDYIRGLEGFSHIWVIFAFSEAENKSMSPTVRPPRLGGNKRVGAFASRSPYRPNSLGLSLVKILKIEEDGILVSGVDMLDNTPIYDIKPYLPYADRKFFAKGSYGEKEKNHKLFVHFPKKYLAQIPKEKRKAVKNCLKDDPRPSYQNDEERIYSMKFSDYDIHFKVIKKHLYIVGINEIKIKIKKTDKI